jgi:protein-disulfide isomerase
MAPDTVVATFNSEKITARQLDEHVKDQLAALEKQKFEIRKNGLESMIIEKLVKAEADQKGMTKEQYLKAEIDSKITPPSDEQIKKVYDQNASRLPPGSTLESFRERIVEYLNGPQKQERGKQLFDGLKKKANVAVMLTEPPASRKQVEAKGPTRGPQNAKVTVVEFSDFQCPFCGRAHDTVEQVMQSYAGKLRLVFRQFPLDFHQNAAKAAEAALCANEQGKFWEYHDVLFKNQDKLEVPKLKEHATAMGLDGAKFADCLDSGKQAAAVKSDMEAGQQVGVTGTPAFFINGVMLSGAQPLDEFKKVIDKELATN